MPEVSKAKDLKNCDTRNVLPTLLRPYIAMNSALPELLYFAKSSISALRPIIVAIVSMDYLSGAKVKAPSEYARVWAKLC